MTYGRWLDTAANALAAAANLARRTHAADHADVATVLSARDRVLRALIGLTSMLEPTTPPQHPTRRQTAADSLPDHAVLLRRVLDGARVPLPARPEPTDGPELADQLATAAHALRVAGDILASHIDPTNGARTLEGSAIRLGSDRIAALAELAHLATRLRATDVHIGRWARSDEAMPPSPAAAHRAALAAISTWLLSLDRSAIAVIADSAAQRSLLCTLTVAAADPTVVAPVPITVADCAATIDDVARWLYRHPDQVEGYHLAAAIRLGQLAATSVWRHLHNGPPPPALAGWRGAALAVGNVAAAAPPHHDARLIQLEHASTVIRTAAGQVESFTPLASRLPRLAAAIRVAAERAVRRGVIFTRSARMQATPVRAAIRRAVVEWVRAAPSDPVIAQLIGGLGAATARQPNDGAPSVPRAGQAFRSLPRLTPGPPAAPSQNQPHLNPTGTRSTRHRT